MPYAYGFCPNCGVKCNVAATSIGTMRRCEFCKAKRGYATVAVVSIRAG